MNNVRDFGAVGDGRTSDTAAIQRAIDAGGEVYFPAGTYKSGTLYLRSNGGLCLDTGAVLMSGGDEEQWNAPDFCPQNPFGSAEKSNGRHLIIAYRCENIAIRGGRIDGKSIFWHHEPNPENPFFKLESHNGQMLYFCECSRVRIERCELSNSPYWHCFLHGCDHVQISGLYIHGDPRVLCNDGIDLDCCRDVTVSDCIIETGDDALTLRGNSARLGGELRPCERITVANCVLSGYFADGIRLGVGNGLIRDCTFSNLVIHDSNIGIELASSYGGEHGVDMENIQFSDIRMNANRPFQIILGRPCYNDFFGEERNQINAVIRNIGFHRIYGRGELSSRIRGNRTGRIDRLTFSDLELDFYGKGPAPYLDEKGHWDKGSTAAAFQIRDTGEILFEKVRVNWCVDTDQWQHEIEAEDAQVKVKDCSFVKGIKI